MNIIKEKEAPLPRLIKQSDTFRMFVPKKVEEKIRYLIRKYPHTEWSGVLFYSHTGSFENKDLVITCEDIHPMDLGTSGWTEFKMDESVAGYIAENIELFDCEIGILHSHHTLGAFLSGQDMKRIQEDGSDTNCFVSLVVDTKGEYVAAITRKVQTKTEITKKSLGTSYEFFGEGEVKTDEDPMTETTQEVEDTVIEYFMLDVEREVVDNPLDYLDRRFEEIEEKKKTKTPVIPSYNPPVKPVDRYWKDIKGVNDNPYSGFYDNDEDWGHWWKKDREKQEKEDKPEPKQQELFDKEEMGAVEITGDWIPDPDLIHAAVVHMLTCSLIVNPEKFDLKQWVIRHMEKKYKEIFNDGEYQGYSAFDVWCDFIVEYLVLHFDDPKGEEYRVMDEDGYTSAVAAAMQLEIASYIDNNKYVRSYYDLLNDYILQ